MRVEAGWTLQALRESKVDGLRSRYRARYTRSFPFTFLLTNERRGKKGKYEKMKSTKKERITIFHIKAERWIILGLSGMRWSAIGDDGRNDDGKKNARIKGGR